MEDPESRRVDYTEMSTYILCPTKWYLRHYCNLVPKRQHAALPFGIAIHAALDAMYQNDFSLDAAMDEWSKAELVPDEKRTSGCGELILRAYHKYYLHQPLKPLHNEVVWELPLDNLPITLCGRIDRVVQWGPTVYVMDHKTTSALGATFFEQFSPNAQIAMYIHAARNFGYPDVNALIVDAIFVGKTQNFMRNIIGIVPRDLATMISEVTRWAESILQTEKELQAGVPRSVACPRTMTPETCTFKWGRCPYRELCIWNYDPARIEADYREEPWIPARPEEGD